MIRLDSISNILWDWERALEVITEVENNSNQVDIIVTKKDYRYEKYLENTVTEIIKLIGSINILNN